MIIKYDYHILNQSPIMVIFLLALFILEGCAVPKRKPCIKNDNTYGIPNDIGNRYDWDSCYRSGVSYSQGECWPQAVTQFFMAIHQKKKDQWMARTYGMHFLDYFPHRELGIVYLRQGRIKEAIEELTLSLLTADSDKTKYYLNKARKRWLEETALDKTPPVILFPDVNFQDNVIFTNYPIYKIKGSAMDDFFVFRIFINDEPLFLDLAKPEIHFEEDLHLRTGENLFNFKVADLVGHEHSQNIRIFFDQQGPTVVFSPPNDISHLPSEKVRIKGIILDESGIDTLKIEKHEISIIRGEKVKEFEVSCRLKAAFYAKDIAGNVTKGTLESIWTRMNSGLIEPRKSIEPPTQIRICYNGSIDTLALSNLSSEKGPEFVIEECPFFVFEPFVTITGRINSTAAIRDVWINDNPVLSRHASGAILEFFRRIQGIVRGGKTFFYFTRVVSLKEGENYITIRAQDEDGLSSLKTIRVEYRVRDTEKIGNRWRLGILPFENQRMKYPFYVSPTPSSLDSVFESLCSAFYETKRFKMLLRKGIIAVMNESLFQDGNSNPLSAEVLLIGSIYEEFDGVDPCIEIKTKLVDTESGEILAMQNVYNRWVTFKDEEYLLKGLTHKYIEHFPILKGKVLDINIQTFEIDLCAEDSLKKGMKVLLFRPDGKNNNIMGEARVEKVAKDYSLAFPVPREILKKVRTGDWVITK